MSKTQGIFITGTDTGVGKTWVGCRLVESLVRRGLNVRPRKPVESGCARTGDGLLPADAQALFEAAGRRGSLEEVCPYRLEAALSPERAAALVGLEIGLAQLTLAAQAQADDAWLLVEGAGGFYSPLASDGLNADLAVALGLPVLLVAADRLGCINQVLLTLQAIESRGLKGAGVVLNQVEADRPADMDNAEDLRARITQPVFETTHGLQGQAAQEVFEALATHVIAAAQA